MVLGYIYFKLGGKRMSKDLINMDDLMAALEELKEVNTNGVIEMSEEMKESERRCKEYIEKHNDEK